jgi:uncharacterized protein YndB with AHSA1/START domain
MTGDRARVSVAVPLDPATAFATFTQEIDQWWRRGARFRNAGSRRGVICIEPGVGGRLFEEIDGEAATHVVEIGRVQVWDPPRRVSFSWRASNFAPHESTHVDVEFAPQRSGTLVTVTHSGFAALRDDHPVRHGLRGSTFCAEMGRWWGDQMASLRESAMLGGRTPKP